MLMVTSSVRMLDGVHSHTTHLRPAVPLGLVLVVRASGLQHGLVDPTSAGDDANHGPVGRRDDLLGAGRQLNPGALGVGVVGDDGGVVAGCSGQLASVSGLLFEVRDDGSLGHHTDGHDVADGQLSLLAAVDELTGVHSLAGDHQFLPDLVPVGVSEVDDGQRSTATGIVNDVPNDALDVAIPLAVVDRPQPGRALAMLGVRLEDGTGALSLSPDHSTHSYGCFTFRG